MEKFLIVTSLILLTVGAIVNVGLLEDFHGVSVSQIWSSDEAYNKGLSIMDMTAFTLCKENDVPIIVFDMNKEGNLEKVVKGEKIGTLVTV